MILKHAFFSIFSLSLSIYLNFIISLLLILLLSSFQKKTMKCPILASYVTKETSCYFCIISRICNSKDHMQLIMICTIAYLIDIHSQDPIQHQQVFFSYLCDPFYVIPSYSSQIIKYISKYIFIFRTKFNVVRL